MVEFVMCIPLLALVLGLTFFFGWAMSNQQHVRISDRYTVWRMLRERSRPTAEELNETFFANRGRQVNLDTWRWHSDTLDYFVDATDHYDRRAGSLADDMILHRFSHGMTAQVHGEFPSDVSLWQRFTGAIRSRHSRQGLEWRCQQARSESAVAEEFLRLLDVMLDTTPAPADRLAQMFRRLYLAHWNAAS